jgi:hypothetical protein
VQQAKLTNLFRSCAALHFVGTLTTGAAKNLSTGRKKKLPADIAGIRPSIAVQTISSLK